jgi:hypothetical protein
MTNEQRQMLTSISHWLTQLGITNYVVNEDFTVDVNGNVYISDRKLTTIPIQFGKVMGDFDCSGNDLISLEGSPKFVKGSFECGNNLLTNLEYSPEFIGANFYCDKNQLTSLKGSPKKIGKTFNCNQNKLKNLEFGPLEVGTDYHCVQNPLVSFKGVCEKINGVLSAGKCNISSLKDLPDFIGESLLLTHNPNLVLNYEDFKDKVIQEKIVVPYKAFAKYESCSIKVSVEQNIMQLDFDKLKEFLAIESEKNKLLNTITEKPQTSSKLKI